jgi:hypothetical protein
VTHVPPGTNALPPVRLALLVLAAALPLAATAAAPPRRVDIPAIGTRALKALGSLNTTADLWSPGFLSSLKVPFKHTTEGDLYIAPGADDQWTLAIQRFPASPSAKAGFQLGLYMESSVAEIVHPCLFTIDTLKDALASHGYTVNEDLYTNTAPRGWIFTKHDIVLRVEERDLTPGDCVRLLSTVD